ncbi:MAG: hypothetical protein Q9227_004627 [Pyrenula ochraceoflavens]
MRLKVDTVGLFETSGPSLERSKEFGRKYETSGLLSDLDQSISHAENALVTVADDRDQRADCLLNLSYRLQQRYDHAHNVADLERAIDLLKHYQEASTDGDEMVPFSYMLLSDYYAKLFEYDHSRESLETAIMSARVAVNIPSLNPYQRKVAHGTLDHRLDTLYDIDGGLKVLDERINIKTKLIAEESLNEAQSMHYRDALARCLREKYDVTKDFHLLDESVRLLRQSVDETSLDHPERSRLLSHLSTSISRRAEADPALYSDSLSESVNLMLEGLQLCPSTGKLRQSLLMDMMNRRRELFEAQGDINDLERAIESGREAVDMGVEEYKEGSMLLQNLAICLKGRYQARGNLDDLDEAIELYRSALSVEERPRDKAMICNNLNIALRQRFDSSAALEDLEEAVQQGRQSVFLIPKDHVVPVEYFDCLGSAFADLYRRLDRQEDLDNAILWSQKAVLLVSQESSDRRMYLNNLASKMWAKYRANRSLTDRDEAVRLGREAVHITPTDDARRSLYVSNLGDMIYNIWNETEAADQKKEDIEEAIAFAQEAKDLTPQSHVYWSDYTTSLAWRLTKTMEEWEELDVVIETFQAAFQNRSGKVLTKIEAGRAAGLFLMFRDKWNEAYDLYVDILGLLSQASPRSVSRDDMQARLSGLSNISGFAACAGLKIGKSPGDALILLEQGRGIIAGLFMNLRADMSRLAESYPSLHEKYQAMLSDLFKRGTTKTDEKASNDPVSERQKLERKLQSIEGAIRDLPGFDMFQMAPSVDQLLELAVSGPLVCFNLTRWRSDAFIVTSTNVEVIPLPELTEQDLKANVRKIVGEDRLTNCSVTKRAANNKTLRKVFKWLWQVAVKRVLEYLQFQGENGDAESLPRIWWIASGPMGLMPLHAAGSLWGTSDQNTASRAISSYSPTFRALAYARERAKASLKKSDAVKRSVLAVPMPTTPLAGWLPLNTDAELSAITSSAESSQTPMQVLSHPTPSTVLSSIKDHPFIHFACHGDPNFKDPSQTSLLLHSDAINSTGDQASRLTVRSLADEDLSHAQLAYLSACCTAQQYRMDLIDENIHLGSAFQLMGFPAVVATLWEADDGAAAVVSGEFYRLFLEGIAKGQEVSDCAARSLYKATRKVRESKKGRGEPSDDVIAWGSFVHIGA